MESREQKIAARISEEAAKYFASESNRQSLITVTRTEVSSDGRTATIFISVLPESAEESVLSFARRSRSLLRKFVMTHLPVPHIPTLDVVLDAGEKHRQHIDDLLRES